MKEPVETLESVEMNDQETNPGSLTGSLTASLKGRIQKYHSHLYFVAVQQDNDADAVYSCVVRGLLKKETSDIRVGDWVILDSVDLNAKTARIYDVLPRTNVLDRPKMANADQVLVVYSCCNPDFDPLQLDRYLGHIALANLPALICISKTDRLKDPDMLQSIEAVYADGLKYTVVYCSIHAPESLVKLYELLAGKITVLAGPSGSGKSSLLNALDPTLQVRVGSISKRINRGKHTTRHVELLSINPPQSTSIPSSPENKALENRAPENKTADNKAPDNKAQDNKAWIADTPGFSHLKFDTVLPVQIEEIYPEFEPYRQECGFGNCLHEAPGGCAVWPHRGQEIAESRYQSYLNLLVEAYLFKKESSKISQKEAGGYKELDRKGKEPLKILRLKEKNRDLSRRAQKQQDKQWQAEDSLVDQNNSLD